MQSTSVVEGLRAVHAALDSFVGADPDVRELRSALSEVARAEARLASVKLSIVAAAEASGLAGDDGSTDTASWVAKATGGNRSRSWGAVWLANHLRDTYGHTADALAQGRISEEHAAIIVAAGQTVPDGVTASQLRECEEALVDKAERMKPAALRRTARRLLAPISQQLADAHQETQLD